MNNSWLWIAVLVFVPFCKKDEKAGGPPPPPANTFVNPIMNGSDPWVLKKDSLYYYTQTSGNRIAIWKTKAMSKLSSVTGATVFSPTGGMPNSANIWAPEIHFFR